MARPARDIPWPEQADNGVFYVHWYDADAKRTRRKTLDTRDADEAKLRYAEFLTSGREIYNGRRILDEGMTGAAAIDYYIAEHVDRNVVDAARQKYAFANIKKAFGNSDLKTLAEEDFEDYAEKRRAGLIGRCSVDATVRREISAFRAAVNHNVRRRRLALQQTPIWWLPDDTPVRCDKWLTKPQLDKLIGAATTKKVEHFIHISYWTAGRKSAVERLQSARVDLHTKKIDLHPPAWKRTKKRNAVVPIVSQLYAVIAPLTAAMDDDDYYVGHDVRKDFAATVKAAGLEGVGATPHWLRHSRATHLLQDGKKLWAVAGLLGDTMETVEKVYGHHCPHQLQKDIE